MRENDIARCAQLLLDAGRTFTALADVLTAAEQAEEKPVTKEEVRTVLAAKSSAGHGKEVRELLQKHGAEQLSGLDPAAYAEVLREAQEIGGSDG